MPLSYDEVEDVRLAVGEACTTAVERAAKANKTDTEIVIRTEISDSTLTIDVIDEMGREPAAPAGNAESLEELDEESLGALLMELLVDEVKVESTPEGGTRVRMTKHAG